MCGTWLRALGIDLLPALLRVAFREQLLNRNLCKPRISDPAIAVGKGQLQSLDQRVYVFRRVVTNRLQVDRLKQIQCFKQDNTLRTRSRLVHIIALVSGSNRRGFFGAIRCEVVVTKQAAILLVEIRREPCQLAAVKRTGTFGCNNLKTACQIRLPEYVAGLEGAAIVKQRLNGEG